MRRGRLRIADRVPARIAWLATREALGLGRDEVPRVSVQVVDGSARVRVGLVLEFGSDLVEQAERVRAAVVDRVGALTGIPAREVVVVVERLKVGQPDV
ncbi:hypothetical protein C7C46_32190 [Streptomyces tateyamensis]|uniref:Asp23/Gls24 family protein n=1 Tax=Streptomyces tateyamensis TaxID=565073 RepID=A0A2V4NH10_9ACTN|nr:hypothetical protein C7C46_32190 [Streptomyces tateyamensis]